MRNTNSASYPRVSASGIGFYKTSRGQTKEMFDQVLCETMSISTIAVPAYTAEMIMKVSDLVIHLCLFTIVSKQMGADVRDQCCFS
jgi:hypothetical protein